MFGEWSLVPHVSHLFLCDVPSVIISGAVAWAGFLFFLAMGATALFFIPSMVVYRPCHVNVEREVWLTPYGVIVFHHVNARKWLRVHFHGKLTKDQTALFYRQLDLLT
jgi:hypothetical protein